MKTLSEDRKADIHAVEDRGEPVSLMEPLLIGESWRKRGEVIDLAVELAAKSAGFRRSLPAGVVTALADLVRSMNCYYSNLIEGHDTRPRDIERALAGEFDRDEGRRNLQLEAAAHVRVQREVDRMGEDGRLSPPASREFLRWLHRELYRDASDAMLIIEDPRRQFRMVPGEWRTVSEHDVVVGRHVPPKQPRCWKRRSFAGSSSAARSVASLGLPSAPRGEC